MKKMICIAALLAAAPVYAGVSIDRASPSLGCGGGPINPATILSQLPAGPPCPVPEVFAAAFGTVPQDNVDAVSANTPTAPDDDYAWFFSGDRATMAFAGTPYRAEAMNNQAASDVWRTGAVPSINPLAVIAGACGAPAMIGPPAPVQVRVQPDYHLLPFLPSGAFFGGVQDNVDALELDDLDPSGNRIHDVGMYFSLDPASPSLGGGSGAQLFFAPPGAAFIPFSGAGNAGLKTADDIDALVIWDRGVIGIMNPLVDIAVFSLAPGSPSLVGPDAIAGTADDLSPADLLVTDFSGIFCLYTRAGQLALRAQDNVDGLDAVAPFPGGGD
jgi:hypothetical protein